MARLKLKCLILVVMLCCVPRLVNGLYGDACSSPDGCTPISEFCENMQTCRCSEGYTPVISSRDCINPCAGFACVSSSTCVVVEDDCACNEGYYPRVTTDGECTQPCDDKPCFGENPASCMNEGELCVCKGTLLDDGAGNCVDACEGKPCKIAAGLLSCTDGNGVCSCGDFYRLADTGYCVDDCHGKPCISLGMCRDELKGDGCYCTNRFIFNKDYNCVSVCTGYACFERDACYENNGVCTCKPGYGFDDDGNCIDGCAGKACVADRNCEVNDDTRLCQCREGLKLNNDGKCVDACSGRDCFERNTCAADEGNCLCHSGLRFDGDKSKCIDIDECTSGTATCMDNSGCVNHYGSYACICDPGYNYVNGKCAERPNTSTTIIIVLGVALGLVLIISIAVCCCLILSWQNRNPLPITRLDNVGYSAPQLTRPAPRLYPEPGPRFTDNKLRY